MGMWSGSPGLTGSQLYRAGSVAGSPSALVSQVRRSARWSARVLPDHYRLSVRSCLGLLQRGAPSLPIGDLGEQPFGQRRHVLIGRGDDAPQVPVRVGGCRLLVGCRKAELVQDPGPPVLLVFRQGLAGPLA